MDWLGDGEPDCEDAEDEGEDARLAVMRFKNEARTDAVARKDSRDVCSLAVLIL